MTKRNNPDPLKLALLAIILAVIVGSILHHLWGAERIPASDVILRDRVDVIEVNHYYDEYSRLVFDQIIFWDFNRHEGMYRVVDWRLMKGCRQEGCAQFRAQFANWEHADTRKRGLAPEPAWLGGVMTPARDSVRKLWVSRWHDFKDRDVLREVTAPLMRETWTQYDPEIADREFLPQERRRELRKLN